MHQEREPLKPKLLIAGLTFIGAIACFTAGMALTAYAFVYLEMNDRLKYEVAYLKGYTKIQRALKEGDTEKASQMADFLIDAHTTTLFEFSYLTSTMLNSDMNEVLCGVISLRKEYPRETAHKTEAGLDNAKKIDQYLSEKNWEC